MSYPYNLMISNCNRVYCKSSNSGYETSTEELGNPPIDVFTNKSYQFGGFFVPCQGLTLSLVDEVKRKLHHLLSQYRIEKEEAQHRVKVQWVEAFRKTGIDGSAVEPNIEVSELWERESGIMDRLYGIKLKEIKEQLRAL